MLGPPVFKCGRFPGRVQTAEDPAGAVGRFRPLCRPGLTVGSCKAKFRRKDVTRHGLLMAGQGEDLEVGVLFAVEQAAAGVRSWSHRPACHIGGPCPR